MRTTKRLMDEMSKSQERFLQGTTKDSEQATKRVMLSAKCSKSKVEIWGGYMSDNMHKLLERYPSNDRQTCGNRIIPLAHIGVGGQKGYIYSLLGLCPTIPATTWKDAIKVFMNE